MDDKSIIRSLFEPTIELDELSVTDAFYNSDGSDPIGRGQRTPEIETVDYPFVSLNGYIFRTGEIKSFDIDGTGFIPTINMLIELGPSSEFLSTVFPKDGDLLNVFIRGRDDLLKPLRNDYIITNIEVLSTQTQMGDGAKIYIEGSLHIPRLYDEMSYVKSGTSFEVLKEIANELGMGFATNVESTNDEMNWICANETQHDFIQHIGDNMWSDEKSFYTVFIDIYYHLNVINCNTQFSDESESLLGMSDSIKNAYLSDKEHEKVEVQKIFSNDPAMEESNFYMRSLKPINNSSSISRTYGYSYNLNFFEHNSLKDWDFPIEPLVTEGNEETKILLKGRPNEDFYKTQQKFNFLGVQYSYPEHNVHEKYYIAKVHNMMNLAEIQKMNVEIVVNKLNFNFIRFEKVPVIRRVVGDQSLARKMNDEYAEGGESQNYSEKFILDKYYTGWYAIKGFRIHYSPNTGNDRTRKPMTQTFILARREWPSISGE